MNLLGTESAGESGLALCFVLLPDYYTSLFSNCQEEFYSGTRSVNACGVSQSAAAVEET